LSSSAEAWAAHGDTSRYAEALRKVAQALESRNPAKAKAKHWQAIHALCPEGTSKEHLNQCPSGIFDLLRGELLAMDLSDLKQLQYLNILHTRCF
jgi:hypothetical protein